MTHMALLPKISPAVKEVRPAYLGGIVTQDPKMQQLVARAQQVANSDASVLILGETGVGKELFAQLIHSANSFRRNRQIVDVNVSALPEDLAASQLFGHKAGAFTGATRDHKGFFEEANGGTIFLDEMGELPLNLQPLLLRVLEQKAVRRLGDSTGVVKSDFRLVCSTNRNLAALVEQKKFREDLYHRIAVIELVIPPLRERMNDIPLLVEAHLNSKKYPESISAAAIRRLKEYSWPGNVRELKNVLDLAIVLAAGSEIKAEHISFRANPLSQAVDVSKEAAVIPFDTPLELVKACFVRSFREAHPEMIGNQVERFFGINRTTRGKYEKRARLLKSKK